MNRSVINFKFGYYISLITSILTTVAFATAIMTPPLSGPWCEGSCFQYPYTDIAGRFPRDYYWMFLAMISFLFYLTMMVCLHQVVIPCKKHFSMLGVAFAMMATMTLFSNYFIQVSVIQPSLLARETDGIALLSQYNAHGIFIALEEIGFLFICISFFCCVPVFSNATSNEIVIKWTAIVSFLLAIISFIIISGIYGINREYRFEIAIISIAWMETIILSLLMARYFRNVLNTSI